jgi:hypothetical protein
MSNHLNPINPDQLQIKTTNETSPLFYEIYGSEMPWVQVQPKTGTTFYDDVNSHSWTNLGIYSESDITKFNITYANGGLSDTMIGDIYTAYNTTGLLVSSLDSSVFRASISPNLRLTIPISGGTGTLSGLTTTDLYTAFVDQNNSKTSDGSGPCATWVVDSLESESHPSSTYKAGIGYANDGVNNPGPNTNGRYESGLMYLFSKDVYLTGNTGTTIDTGWSGTSRYTFGGSELVTFNGPTRNVAVGMIQLDTGVITIFNPNIVSSFNTGIATGGTITSGLTFNTSDCSGYLRDRDTSTALEINTILPPEEYTKSFNPSLLDAKERGIDCSGQVSVTKICFYDEFGVLTATGGLSEALIKRERDFISVLSTVTLDNGIQSPVYDTDSRTTFSPGIS